MWISYAHSVRALSIWYTGMLGLDQGEKVSYSRCYFLHGTQGFQGECDDSEALG